MFDINHEVGIKASPETIYEALTTDKGLATWWTDNVRGAGKVGSVIRFRFGESGHDFKVTELIPGKIVRWSHSGSWPESWLGTEVLFQIKADEDQTFVRFTHSRWQESTDFMAHCSTKWAVFLISLKDALESNRGRPFPNDIQVNHS